MAERWLANPWIGVCVWLLTLLAIVLFVIWRYSGRIRALMQMAQCQSAESNAVREELRAVASALDSARSGFNQLGRELSIDSRFGAAAALADHRHIDFAVRGARSGASEKELIRSYGVSRQEAACLRSVHGSVQSFAGLPIMPERIGDSL